MTVARLSLALLAFASSAALAESVQYDGVAYDAKSGKKLYIESHFLKVDDKDQGERVVLYRCPDGVPFARKVVDYTGSFAPPFEMNDPTIQYREGVRLAGGKPEVFYQKAGGDGEQKAPLEGTTGLVADAGFDLFIRHHFDELEKGETLKFPFLVPSRLSGMDFKLSKQKDEIIDGQPTSVIRLSLNSFFSFALPHMDVAYDKSQHLLTRFVGMSNIRDGKGDNYEVRIDFDAKGRKPMADEALADAKKTPLSGQCKAG